MSIILDIFLCMDSFGARPSFYIDGNKEYHSFFGGILTIIVWIVTIGCASYFAQRLWEKNDPSVSTATLITNHPQKLLYPHPFFFMITVDVDYIPTIDESMYLPKGYIHITHVDKNGTSTTEKKYFDLKVCSEIIDETHPYYDLLKDFDLNNFYCMPKFIEKENDIYLNDYWGNDGFSMLQVKVYTCGIYNDKSKCKSTEEIDKVISDSILSYYTINQYVDTTNYSHPFIKGLPEHYLALSTAKRSTFTSFMRHVSVESDIGLIFSRKKTEYGLTLDSYIDLPNKEDVKNGYLFGISIQLTNTIDYYKRSYYKLQNLCEDIGAIYGVLTIIVKIIQRYYNEAKLSIDLINSFFIIKDKNEENLKIGIIKKAKVSKPKIHKDDNSSCNETKRIFFSKSIKLIPKVERKSEVNITNDDSNISKCNRGYIPRFSVGIANKNFNLISNSINNNCIYKNYINNYKNENQMISRKKLVFNFYQKLFCINCCKNCRKCGNKKNDYVIYEKGIKYISELLEIKNILKKLCIDNMKYSLDYDELERQKIEEMSKPILSLDQAGKNLPLPYLEKIIEHEGFGEVQDAKRNKNKT